jgi:hypothetical protein
MQYVQEDTVAALPHAAVAAQQVLDFTPSHLRTECPQRGQAGMGTEQAEQGQQPVQQLSVPFCHRFAAKRCTWYPFDAQFARFSSPL